MTDLTVVSGDAFDARIYIAGDLSVIRGVCQRFTDQGACVTVTPTDFVFTGGIESGAIIGFINYQRFPSTPEKIRDQAVELTEMLIKECYQLSASVVTTTESIFISDKRKT